MKKHTKKILYILAVCILAASFVLEKIFVPEHMAGYHILLGFAGAWALILFAKKVLAPLIQKKEDYYGGNDD